MSIARSPIIRLCVLVLGLIIAFDPFAADLIVSGQDGKFVRVEGKATFPEPAPPDSLVVIDASRFPPVVTRTLEGLEHTVQGPPEAVAVTPDGKLAIVGAPTRYDYAAKKELFDTFLQIIDIESSPPRLLAKVDVGAHPNGLSINREARSCLLQLTTARSRCCRSRGRTSSRSSK